MLTFHVIVCAVDFSEHSRLALMRAGAWATRFGARLIITAVAEPLLVDAAAAAYDMDLLRDEVLPELRDFVEKARAAGAELPTWEAVVLTGEPASEIVGLAGRERADLIVLATHGLSGYHKMLLGSTTEKILRQTTVPVLVAPRLEQVPATLDSTMSVSRVLAPVDLKRPTLGDLRAARDLARTLRAPLLILHVVAPVRGLERLRSALDTHNRVQIERSEQQIRQLISELDGPADIETAVVVGSPAEEIARTAVARDVGLIVMGLRGQEHLFAPRPGSVTYRVLSLAPVPVLALPPKAIENIGRTG